MCTKCSSSSSLTLALRRFAIFFSGTFSISLLLFALIINGQRRKKRRIYDTIEWNECFKNLESQHLYSTKSDSQNDYVWKMNQLSWSTMKSFMLIMQFMFKSSNEKWETELFTFHNIISSGDCLHVSACVSFIVRHGFVSIQNWIKKKKEKCVAFITFFFLSKVKLFLLLYFHDHLAGLPWTS